nr:MAG TPA: hypothetical protein [Caudoviricetes sp.]
MPAVYLDTLSGSDRYINAMEDEKNGMDSNNFSKTHQRRWHSRLRSS